MSKKGLTILLGGLTGLVACRNPDLITKTVDQTVKAVDKTVTFIEAFHAAYIKQAIQIVEAQHRAGAAEVLLPPYPNLKPPPSDSLENLLAALGQKGDPPAIQSHPQRYVPPVDEPLARLVHHPSVVLILGHRGSGKTALAIRLQELLRDVAAPYAVDLPAKAKGLLPDWYGLAPDFDTIPNNSVVYVSESYRMFHARETRSSQGRIVAELVNLSRHRRHTLIFDVQNAAQLDRNIVSEADLVLVKEPGPFQAGFERNQFQGLMDQARSNFAAIGKGKKKQAVWVVSPKDDIAGQLMQNELPTIWSDSLSRIFNDASVSISGDQGTAKHGKGKADGTRSLRPGKRTPSEVKREKAQQMRENGFSYGEIAGVLHCSRSYAHKLVNGSK